MKRELIATGKTVEDAILSACEQLTCDREQLSVEVLELPTKKMLGFLGSSLAKIKATLEEPDEVISTGPLSGVTIQYLKTVLEKMGAKNISIDVKEDNGTVKILLTGESMGSIIGRRGETLDSLQYLVSLVENRQTSQYKRITLDSGDYREKREQTLERIAKNAANTAIRNRKNTTLEPMNPYERRIIHSVVQNIKGSTSWSIGEEPYRRVVIGPENGAGRKDDHNTSQRDRGGRDQRRSGDGNRSQNNNNSFGSNKPRERKAFVSREDSNRKDRGAGDFENVSYLEKAETRRQVHDGIHKDAESYRLYEVIKPSNED